MFTFRSVFWTILGFNSRYRRKNNTNAHHVCSIKGGEVQLDYKEKQTNAEQKDTEHNTKCAFAGHFSKPTRNETQNLRKTISKQ